MPMMYINANTKKIYSEYELPCQNKDALAKFYNIYPRKTIEPEYDPRLEYLTTEKEGVLNGEYVIVFRKLEKSESMQANAVSEEAVKKIQEISKQADAHVSSYTSLYPEIEQSTWDQQEQEAKNADQETPLIDALAENRNITRDAMIEKVLDKVNYFTKIKIDTIAKSQSMRDEVKQIETSDMSPREKLEKIDNMPVVFA